MKIIMSLTHGFLPERSDKWNEILKIAFDEKL